VLRKRLSGWRVRGVGCWERVTGSRGIDSAFETTIRGNDKVRRCTQKCCAKSERIKSWNFELGTEMEEPLDPFSPPNRASDRFVGPATLGHLIFGLPWRLNQATLVVGRVINSAGITYRKT
jgi:hypothetical protein